MNQDFLKQTILFQDLTEEELVEVLIIGHVQNFKAGEVIFREGDPGDRLFLIIDGSVRISKFIGANEEALAILEPKSYFGEMTILDAEPRSAWAIAHDNCVVFSVECAKLLSLFEVNRQIGYKFLWAFAITLAKRLRMTNDKFNIMMSIANLGF
jgi:CRP-like cAMP-binding protein